MEDAQTAPQRPAHAPAAGAPRTERLADLDGLTICYDHFGDPANPALLLIMGLGAQMVLWDEEFCEALAARGLFVIRFDNRDIGRSQWFDGAPRIDLPQLLMAQMRGDAITAPYLLADMAQDAAALLSHLGIAKAHICGASMGGMIAQEMAMLFPDRVLSLTSIMSSTGDPSLPGPRPEAAAVLMRPPATGRDEFIQNFCGNWKILRPGEYPDDEARDPARAALMYDRGVNIAGVGRQLLAIFASGSRAQRLRDLALPSLVIHGSDDPLVPIEAGRATAAAIPHAKLLELPRMGHTIPLPVWPQIIDAIAVHCSAAQG